MTHLMAAVIQASLNQTRLKLVEIIHELGFGIIEGLSIRDGQPCFEPAPRIVQLIKLGSYPEPSRQAGDNDKLHKAFAYLFEHLGTLGDCTVNIEVQHGLPFRLIVERSCEEFA